MKHLRYLVGTVTGTVSAGTTGLSGVAVNLVGGVSQSATTGAGGTYTFTNVPAGSYGVSIDPSSQPDVSFSQVSRTTTITVNGETQTVDFSGSYIKTATITGIVSASGAPLAGIAVTVAGGPEAISAGFVTNGGGEYFATGLRGGTYTVTIADVAGVNFAMTSASVTVGTGETKTAHFPGEAIQMAAISGAVTVDNVGTAGIAVAITGGAATETGPGGAYAFTNLTPGTYTVTITPPAEVVFETVAKDVTVGAGETGVVNFSGVGPLEPATVSIKSLTYGGATPVDLDNASDQFEITLNITRNDQTLKYVDIIFTDPGDLPGTEDDVSTIVATQVFAVAASPAEMIGEIEEVTLSIQSTQLTQGTTPTADDDVAWVPAVPNGAYELSASLVVFEDSEPIPTNKKVIVLQNDDVLLGGTAFGGDLEFYPAEPDRTALGEFEEPAESWYAGGAVATGWQFVAYSTITPENVEFPLQYDQDGYNIWPDDVVIEGDAFAGIVLTMLYDMDGIENDDIEVDWDDFDEFDYGDDPVGPDGTAVHYVDDAIAAICAIYYLSDPDAQIGPRRYIIHPEAVQAGQITDPGMLNFDNVAPDVWIYEEGVVAFNDDFSEYWVKGDYDFVEEDVMSEDGGVGFVTEKAFLWNWQFTYPDGWEYGDDCLTTELTTPADTPLPETLTSDDADTGGSYAICGFAADALNNMAYTSYSESFGVDMQAPSARIWGDDASDAIAGGFAAPLGDAGPDSLGTAISETMNMTVFGTTDMMGTGAYHYADMDVMHWGLDAIDDRAGLDTNGIAGYPFYQRLIGNGPALTQPDTVMGADGYGPILTDNWVRVDAETAFLGCLTEPGIFTYEGYAIDRAGNPSEVFYYNWLVDDVGYPMTTAVTPVTTSYLVGQPAMFNVWGSDDMEIMELGFFMTYPASGPVDVNFYYGDQAVAADRWDDTFMNMLSGALYGTSTVYGRIDFTGPDGAVPGGITYAADTLALPTSVTVELTEDAGFNPGDDSTATWDFISYSFGGWGTVDDVTAAPWDDENLDFFTISDTGTEYLVEQISDSSIDEFVMDEVWLVAFGPDDPAEMMVCGMLDGSNNTNSDNGTNRFYQYTFAYPTAGNPCYAADMPAGWSIRAVGVEGDALLVTDEEEILPGGAIPTN